MQRLAIFAILIFFLSCDENELFVHCDSIIWYYDEDGDGYGDPGRNTTSCQQPEGYLSNPDDCDDTNPLIFEPVLWYIDADGDGMGDETVSILACIPPQGYVLNDDDDDDTYNAGVELLADFDDYFYGIQWLCDDYFNLSFYNTNYAVMIGMESTNSNIEGINMDTGIVRSGYLSYERIGDKVKIESPIFENIFRFSEQPLYITSISANTMFIEDANGVEYEFHEKSQISGCKFDRLINADWLVLLSTENGDEDCINFERIKLVNEETLAGKPLNLFGSIATPEYPQGVPPTIANGSNDVIAVNGCTNLYAYFPHLIYNNNCGPNLFEFDEAVINGDRLLCGGYEFLIVD